METTMDFIATTEDVSGLLPCPFCGSGYQEIWETGNDYGIPNRQRFRVECECGAGLDSSCAVYPYENAEAIVAEAARREWNRRSA